MSSSTDTGPIRRRRGQLSCTSCKKKKLACDRKSPCDRCKQRRETCVYEDISVRHASIPPLHPNTSTVVSPVRSKRNKIQISTTTTRRPIAYFTLHSLVKFFAEIPQLTPFFAETVQEWLQPSGINMKKPKLNVPVELPLETLLPPSADTDHLVDFYLDHFERLHRVIHIPTFRRQYAATTQARDTAFDALVLAMLSIAVSADPSSISVGYRAMAGRWIWSCERWLSTQSSKHRDLVHYQVWCLVYLAKRVNSVHKKHYWTDTGSLVQHAIFDGITQHPPGETVYSAEIRKRLWLTIRELDLQNSFEYGLPTLLYNVRVGIGLPSNVEDEDFDEATEVIVERSGETRMAFQLTSAMSFEIRLETSQKLFGGRASMSTNGIVEDYDAVLGQTHRLTQAIPTTSTVHPFIRSQIQICILAIHRPYLDIEHELSLDICYQLSRDILLRFSNHGFVPYIRDDINTAFLTVVRICLLDEDKADNPVKLLEENLSGIDQRYLQSYDGEPKVLLTLHAGVMLLKLHLGLINRSDAKYQCAQTFLQLHEKKLSDRQMNQNQSQSHSQAGSMDDTVQLFDYDLFDFDTWFTEETERDLQ